MPDVDTNAPLATNSDAALWRLDLVSPGDLTRDAEGRITGCTNLVVNSVGGNLDE